MSAAHTPGTWIVKPWSAHDQDGALDACGFQVVAADGLEEVGIFSSATEGATEHETADLHLIAAAPDMLAVLLKLRRGDLHQRVRHLYDEAQAAIAKAGGSK